MALLDKFRFDPNNSRHAFCKVCDKKLRVWTDNEKKDFTNLYRHYRVMHHTSIEKRPKYPTLKRSTCDLNDEGPQTKYHKVGDQNLHQFENIGAMKGGGVINEEESLYSDNESNDDEVEDDNDVETGDEDNNESNDEDDNENSVNDSDEDNDDDESDDDGDEEDNDDQSIGSDLEEEEDDENILSNIETHEMKKLINFMRPIKLVGEKFLSIMDKQRFFFHFLGYENEEHEELARLGKKIYKYQQILLEFIKNEARKTPLYGGLQKMFTLFSSEKFSKLCENSKGQTPFEDWWYYYEDFFCNFLNETRHEKKAQLFTDFINDNVIATTSIIENMYNVYSKHGIQYIKKVCV